MSVLVLGETIQGLPSCSLEIVVPLKNTQGLKRENLGPTAFRKKFIDSGRQNGHCVLN